MARSIQDYPGTAGPEPEPETYTISVIVELPNSIFDTGHAALCMANGKVYSYGDYTEGMFIVYDSLQKYLDDRNNNRDKYTFTISLDRDDYMALYDYYQDELWQYAEQNCVGNYTAYKLNGGNYQKFDIFTNNCTTLVYRALSKTSLNISAPWISTPGGLYDYFTSPLYKFYNKNMPVTKKQVGYYKRPLIFIC